MSQCCEIIAELSANHNGSLDRAKEIVRAAAKAGANTLKLQTYTADTLTIPSEGELFQIKGTQWDKESFYSLYQRAAMPWEWTKPLMELSHALGLECFSTPTDATSLDFLESCGMMRYKIASFELVDIPLLKRIASTGKAVVLSTGMATLAEIDEAVSTLRAHGTADLTLLKCTSAYPASAEECNLRTIPHMAEAFCCPVGLSDHTMGSAVAVAAVSLGAVVIEKHFTLARKDGGPDSAFSMEPHEFKQMVADVRTAEKALGSVNYGLTEKQKESALFRRSLFAVCDIKAGEAFTVHNVRCIRPAHGLHPRYLELILKKSANRDIQAGEPLDWNFIS